MIYDHLFQLFDLVDGQACGFDNLSNRKIHLFQLQSCLNGFLALDFGFSLYSIAACLASSNCLLILLNTSALLRHDIYILERIA
ncbi:hypothetical protein C8N37_106485 [Sphingobacterium faecium]|nr:hypothetical protein C8N37_106485 [Sphingobacterium faecium]